MLCYEILESRFPTLSQSESWNSYMRNQNSPFHTIAKGWIPLPTNPPTLCVNNFHKKIKTSTSCLFRIHKALIPKAHIHVFIHIFVFLTGHTVNVLILFYFLKITAAKVINMSHSFVSVFESFRKNIGADNNLITLSLNDMFQVCQQSRQMGWK